MFLLDNRWGLGLPILNSLFVLSLLIFIPQVGENKKSAFYLLASVGLSIFLAFRSFEPGRFITIVLVYLLNVLAIVRSREPDEPLTIKTLILAPILYIVRAIVQIGHSWSDLVPAINKIPASKRCPINISQLLGGALLGTILVFLFTYLFIQADPLFARYFQNILSNFKLELSTRALKRIIESIFVFGLFSTLLRPQKDSFKEFSLIKEIGKHKVSVLVATTAASLIIALFLLVQAQELFAGKDLLEKMQISLSEYTRKGFFELILVSFVSLPLVYVLVQKTEGGKKIFGELGVAYLFIFEVLLLLGSAFRRVYLYQAEFGFTQARVLGIFLSIWLLGVLLVFLARLYGKIAQEKIAGLVFLNTVLVAFIMNFANTDYLVGIVKKPNLGYKVDHAYVTRPDISNDAWLGWEDALDYYSTSCDGDGFDAISNLEFRLSTLEKNQEKGLRKIGAWVSSDNKAYEFLKKNEDKLRSLRSRLENCLQLVPSPVL